MQQDDIRVKQWGSSLLLPYQPHFSFQWTFILQNLVIAGTDQFSNGLVTPIMLELVS